MKAEADRCMLRERAYAMKKHHARRLHYDLRLEWNGALLSWALPKGPSYRAGVIRQAIEMGDHSRANLLFEGVHETGTIALWDRGTWEPHPESDDIEGSLRRGILRFTLHGERLKGAWSLVRKSSTKNTGRPIWTLCKDFDAFADDTYVLEEQTDSITGKSIEQIAQDWMKPREKHQRQFKLFDI